MHYGPTASGEYLRRFLGASVPCADRTLAFFPPAASLVAVADALRDRSDIRTGAQNIHWREAGAFTGEMSAAIAREAGAAWVLVGHSERRHLFGETERETGLKCVAAVRAGLTPVLCVGETLPQREADATAVVVEAQLTAGLAGLSPVEIRRVLIAYEPVWAIGTGRNATPTDAGAIHSLLRRALEPLTDGAASSVPILYGGSVNPENVAALLSAPDVDGVLVGGASLDPERWAALTAT
jgi:triosephosphate isomerase